MKLGTLYDLLKDVSSAEQDVVLAKLDLEAGGNDQTRARKQYALDSAEYSLSALRRTDLEELQ